MKCTKRINCSTAPKFLPWLISCLELIWGVIFRKLKPKSNQLSETALIKAVVMR